MVLDSLGLESEPRGVMGRGIQNATPVSLDQLEEELIRGLRSGPAIEMGPAEWQELGRG
jgi:hypothetical protein